MDASLFHQKLVSSDRIIYTPSGFARINLLHLQEIGSLQAMTPHTSRRENLSSYLFFLVQKGSGELEYDGRRQKLQPGDCVFIDCHSPYFHRTSQDLWSLQWVHFYGPNMGAIYEKYRERGGRPCFHPQSIDPFVRLLADIHALAASSDHVRDMKISERLTALLCLLMEESWNPERSRSAGAGRRNPQEIKEYIDENYKKKLTLDELSERFYLNKFYLTRIFREQYGITVNAYLLSVRITHAKQLLRFSDLTVEKIGHECGMNDANYFTRIFKKIEGITPGEYRKQW